MLAAGLGWYYCSSALEHARVINTAKSRGDQSAYLFEAQILYRNWHGLNDPPVVQPRNRMPLYPAFLATIYQPAWTDPQFFEVAKTASIYLSLGLVAVIAVAALRRLPPFRRSTSLASSRSGASCSRRATPNRNLSSTRCTC